MTTPFQAVYDKFLGKISDYSFVNLTDPQLDAILKGYLVGAIPKFKACKVLSRDDATKLFDSDLTEEETEILGTLMVVEWLNPQINSTLIIKQAIGEKDFKMTSQANHLDSLMNLRKSTQIDADDLIMSYTFIVEDVIEMNRS